MARTTGPLFSLDASGSVGGALTFSRWKGRSYVRRLVIPSNPKSGAQVGRRAMLSWISKAWAALSTGEKAGWQTLAEEINCAPFNAYVKYNMEAWHNFLMPTQTPPAARAGTPSDRAISVCAWEENRIKISHLATALNDGWGMMIFASLTTGFDTSVGTAIMAVTEIDLVLTHDYWTPPSVDTWYFNSRAFSDDGAVAAEGGEYSAVP